MDPSLRLRARSVARPAVEVGESFPHVDPLASPARDLQTVLLTGQTKEPTDVEGTVSGQSEGILRPETKRSQPAVELLQDLWERLGSVHCLLLYPG